MKIFFGTILALALLTCSVHAQKYGWGTVTPGFSQIAGSSATNGATTAVIDCRKCQNVALQLKTQSDAANTANTVFAFAKSVDGTSYGADVLLVPVANAGTTATHAVTNFVVGGIGYLKLAWVSNAAASAVVTNFQVRYSTKLNAP
jgi:hypothetical protein